MNLATVISLLLTCTFLGAAEPLVMNLWRANLQEIHGNTR
jgi:hypothetical protein